MCTIALLVNTVADASLVIAANRDEMYSRAARSPEHLGDGIVGGVDELSGGTWLAIHPSGRFAAVTNQRAMAPPLARVRSRGLVVRELCARSSLLEMDTHVRALDPTHYASMNLVWGDISGPPRVGYLRHGLGTTEILELPRGVHVLCNDRLGAPGFPRGERLAAGIAAAHGRGEAWPAIADTLATLLASHEHVEPVVPGSHLPVELERELTATCIHTPIYGTRSSTIAAFARGGVIGYRHADGPPCTSPFVDGMGLFA